MKKKTTRRRIRVGSVLLVLTCLVLGGVISFLGLNKYIKPEPDLQVQIEMRNVAKIAAFDGLLLLDDEKYEIIDYTPQSSVTVRGETHDCVVYFSDGKMETSEFSNNMRLTTKIIVVVIGSLAGLVIGTIIGSIIRKKPKK